MRKTKKAQEGITAPRVKISPLRAAEVLERKNPLYKGGGKLKKKK